ncbi:hypothetical protein [Phytoactinopolyspora halotolerans]|uniref:Glycosyltransferase n=1 Tax=Phytoactinopolyspora halotolerans TaxID=1981512 RepID=A0A6L9S8Q9_9ACTN|nr:hypothetical protein [Phytoactinopolyspora halotolerans]NEE01449.1 hypothetical protein [Phytoactinopolyspora halotolerans]
MRSYDIVVVTDPRLVGGGNKSLAQEIRAHARRGYTTGLMPYVSNSKGARIVDVSIRELLDEGLVEWVRPDDGVRCALALARGPSLFLEAQPAPVRLHAERAVLVANAVHVDAAISKMAYNPDEVDATLADVFGRRWEWVPLSDVVRGELRKLTSTLDVSAETWANIVDLDQWRLPRANTLRRPFLLGRHSRDDRAKWPESAREILAAYPSSPEYQVRVMGGARTAAAVLGELPATWTVEPFGARHPRSFLADVDVYPYFHHPRWVEAFGRAPLEAIATGAVTILPEYLRAVFGPGALYAEPDDVQGIVKRLADDPGMLAERREAGWQTVRERFGPEAYVARIARLIGPPSASEGRTAPFRSRTAPGAADTVPARPDSPRARPRRRVVFFTDNGHGLGHISRMLAIATRCSPDVMPFMLTMSEAYGIASGSGVPAEYFPSWKRLGLDRFAWRELLRIRLRQLVQRLRPELVVVDHVNPPPLLFEIAAEYPGLRTMWVRRGLWRAGRRPGGAKYSHLFDHILEPLDLAAAMDRGATTRMPHENIHHVGPINLVDTDQMPARDEARHELGLPGDGAAILLNMSADTTQDLVRLITHVRDNVRRRRPGATLFAPEHVLHADRLPQIDGVVMKPIYPVARYLHAFDAAVSTTGYNTFHEIVLAGTPCVFMARQTGSLDDQALRARTATLGGFGLHVDDVWSAGFVHALNTLLDPVRARRMRRAAAVAHPGNGAADAARVVSAIATGREVR